MGLVVRVRDSGKTLSLPFSSSKNCSSVHILLVCLNPLSLSLLPCERLVQVSGRLPGAQLCKQGETIGTNWAGSLPRPFPSLLGTQNSLMLVPCGKCWGR